MLTVWATSVAWRIFVTLGTALDAPGQTGAECQISAQRDYWCRRDPKPQFTYWGFDVIYTKWSVLVTRGYSSNEDAENLALADDEHRAPVCVCVCVCVCGSASSASKWGLTNDCEAAQRASLRHIPIRRRRCLWRGWGDCQEAAPCSGCHASCD